METRNGLITFGIFVLLFAFTFVFCLEALIVNSTFYGVLALIGFVVSIATALFYGLMAKQNGEALAPWFNTYALLVGIVFVWYLTRVGTAFRWW
ncbi:MAG TPA: hypothetical protein VFL04_01880 [Rectinemataceae bacterium]|nr:hypothetical protein [Rectinemataceae bacterium]